MTVRLSHLAGSILLLTAFLTMPAAVADPATVVPIDCDCYIEARQIDQLGERFGMLPVAALVEESELLDATAAICWDASRMLAAAVFAKPLDQLCRTYARDLGLSVRADFRRPGAQPQPVFALVVELNENAAALRKLVRQSEPRIRSLGKKMRIERLRYQKVTIETIVNDKDQRLSHAFVGNFWLLGNFDEIQKMIDVASGQRAALSSDPGFAAFRKNAGDIMTYADVGRTLLMKAVQSPKDSREAASLGIQRLTALLGSARATRDGVRSATLMITEGKPSGVLGLLWNASDPNTKALEIVPADYHLIATADVGTGRQVREMFTKMLLELHGTARVEKARLQAQNIQAFFGIDLKTEIEDQFTGGLFMACDVPPFATQPVAAKLQFFTTSKMIVGWSLKNTRAFQQTIEKLAAQPMLQQRGLDLNFDLYKNQTTYKLELPNAPFLLHYAFVDDWIVIAFDVKTLRKVIDDHAAGKTVMDSPEWQAHLTALPRKATLRVLANLSPLWREAAVALGRQQTELQFGPILFDEMNRLAKGELRLSLGCMPTEHGLQWESLSQLGEPFLLTAAGLFIPFSPVGPASHPHLAQTYAELARLRRNLQRYRAAQGRYPERLEQLAPRYVNIVPADPCDPERRVRYAVSPQGDHFVLMSVGPDKRPDLELASAEVPGFVRQLTDPELSRTAADQLKAKLYRFRFLRHADEAAADDEGDIVLISD